VTGLESDGSWTVAETGTATERQKVRRKTKGKKEESEERREARKNQQTKMRNVTKQDDRNRDSR